MRTLIALLLLSVTVTAAASQDRMREILALFNKSKNVHKSKHGVTKQRFLEKHGEPYSGRDIAGTYFVEGLNLDLRLNAAGSGEGTDPRGAFTLRDARREGALLTATKVYTDGRTGKLEGVFMTLVTRDGKTPADAVTSRQFGLGVMLDVPYLLAGHVELEKVFYERR
ncbi:MAG TPA: hypothetical protein VND45_07530 [Thermoanaerobaculia bacterium]|nr:hypothetical protein [Thermoanaerobaculia bacterium]